MPSVVFCLVTSHWYVFWPHQSTPSLYRRVLTIPGPVHARLLLVEWPLCVGWLDKGLPSGGLSLSFSCVSLLTFCTSTSLGRHLWLLWAPPPLFAVCLAFGICSDLVFSSRSALRMPALRFFYPSLFVVASN